MKQFVFLYPIPEYIDYEIDNHSFGDKTFRQKYKTLLNKCIDLRYRQNGFGINYVLFNKSPVSDVVELKESDRIIEVGLDFKTFTTKQPDETYHYPDEDYILNQLNASIIRISGFHMWDCVEKLAKKAYERGLDTLVDEDLTEFFTARIKEKVFRLDAFPGHSKENIRKFEEFIEVRKNKPWCLIKY